MYWLIAMFALLGGLWGYIRMWYVPGSSRMRIAASILSYALLFSLGSSLAVFSSPAAADKMQARMNAGLKRFDERIAHIDAMIADQKRKMAQKTVPSSSQSSSNGGRK